jgi:preprotein translocase subunit SecE
MSGIDEAKWHWAEGMKFAQKGFELLFFLNGAASISILTFIGNTRTESKLLVWAIVCFAVGASLTIVLMVIAYLVQLSYGNASLNDSTIENSWAYAAKMHHAAYPLIVVCILSFLVGTILAADGLMHIQRTNASVGLCTIQQGQDSSIISLTRERDDTLFEIQLRQAEIDRMMASVKGSLGVGHEWLERKAALIEKMTQLQVKAYDLDLQIVEKGGQSIQVPNIQVPKRFTLIEPTAKP